MLVVFWIGGGVSWRARFFLVLAVGSAVVVVFAVVVFVLVAVVVFCLFAGCLACSLLCGFSCAVLVFVVLPCCLYAGSRDGGLWDARAV